jgi:hypothetical protein
VNRVRELLATNDEREQALRTAGGLLVGVGALVLFIRRAGFPNAWGDGALFAVLSIPCVYLYGTGFIAARGHDRPKAWEAAYLVFGMLLLPTVLLQLLDWLGASPGAPLNIAWVFVLAATAGVVAALAAGVHVALLLAGLALIVSWLALWDELLTAGVFEDDDLLRWLFLAIGLLLVGVAVGLRLARPGPNRDRWSELITVGGVSVIAGAGGFLLVESYVGNFFGGPSDEIVGPRGSWFWDTVMLVASLALIWWGGYRTSRGPAYLGAIGLALFVVQVGLDIDDVSPSGKIVGWPLIVLGLGAVAILASFVSTVRHRPERAGEGQTVPPPGQT